MKVEFDYYLHDNYQSDERADWIKSQIKVQCPEIEEMSDEELSELIGRPFYEVTLKCQLDTETGAVELLGATL